jgi:rhamnosyltransferase
MAGAIFCPLQRAVASNTTILDNKYLLGETSKRDKRNTNGALAPANQDVPEARGVCRHGMPVSLERGPKGTATGSARGLKNVVETSILVLAKNEAHNIPKCLDAVFSQQVDSRFEVIFIDSGSSDGTIEIAKQYPIQLHQIPPDQFHHSRTRNFAASLAAGKYLVYLAADAFPVTPFWLSSLIDNFKDESIKAVYGRHLPKPGSKLERQLALSTLYGPERVVKDASSRDRLGYRYYHFSTVNAAIRRETWAATGFPDDLKVFEDIAIAKRILDRGWAIVYEPNAAVLHSHDYPAPVLFRRYFDIGVVYGRLGIWDSKSRSSVRDDGVKKIASKIASLRPGRVGSVGSALWHDAAKASGLVLGRNERLLPRFLKRQLSAFRLFE